MGKEMAQAATTSVSKLPVVSGPVQVALLVQCTMCPM